MEEDKFITAAHAVNGIAKYQTIIKSNGHQILADEPEIKGGANTGIDPQALLLASLGSCTAITLRMYAERKKWAIDEIGVDLRMFKSETDYTIKSALSFTGELTDEQRTRLLQIANACPIHKLLQNCVRIETSIK